MVTMDKVDSEYTKVELNLEEIDKELEGIKNVSIINRKHATGLPGLKTVRFCTGGFHHFCKNKTQFSTAFQVFLCFRLGN